MAQLRGIPRTAQDAASHSQHKHDPGGRTHRGITNKFDILASPPRQRGEDEGEGSGLHLPVSERFRERQLSLFLARERRLVSCMTLNPANIRTDNLALSVYKIKIAF